MKTINEMYEPNGRLVEVNGHSVHVYTEGDNKNAPLLVFLSGAGTAAPVYDFKPLYSLLSGDFRIAVVEKIGYGYSEIADVPRDIDSILSETRAEFRTFRCFCSFQTARKYPRIGWHIKKNSRSKAARVWSVLTAVITYTNMNPGGQRIYAVLLYPRLY